MSRRTRGRNGTEGCDQPRGAAGQRHGANPSAPPQRAQGTKQDCAAARLRKECTFREAGNATFPAGTQEGTGWPCPAEMLRSMGTHLPQPHGRFPPHAGSAPPLRSPPSFCLPSATLPIRPHPPELPPPPEKVPRHHLPQPVTGSNARVSPTRQEHACC